MLFVDDERRVLTSMRAMFRRDYEVLLANSGQEAIDLLRDHAVDVIVSDQRMPGMTGVEVLKAVKRLAPNAMRILLTGYADLKAIEASINEGEVFRYLTKPCPSEELKEAIGLAADIAANGEQAAAEPARSTRRFRQRCQRRRRRARAGPAPTNSTRPQPMPLRKPHIRPRQYAGRCRAPLTPIMRRPAHKPGTMKVDKKGSRSDIHDVDLLVLTRDATMVAAIETALDGSHRLHHVQSLEAAVAALEAHPIGVMVTDTASAKNRSPR